MEENGEELLLKYEKQSKVFKKLMISQIIILFIIISIDAIIFVAGMSFSSGGSGMSQAPIATFNNQFLKYEGEQKGTVVKSLINEAIASNRDEEHISEGLIVTVTLGDTEMEGSEISTTGIEPKNNYEIELEYLNGRVKRVIINPIKSEE